MTDEETPKLSIPEMSIDTRMLVDHFKAMPTGSTATYQELHALIGRDVQSAARSNVHSAIRHLLNNDSIVIACVRTVGYKRLADSDILGTGEQAINHIRRSARRGFQKVTAVQDYEALSADEKRRYNTLGSVLAMANHIAKGSSIKKVESKVADSAAMLSIANTLDAFKE